MAVFILGIARYQPKIPEIKKYNNNEITILARVAKEPEIKENSIQLTLKGTRLIAGEDVLDVEGKFLVNVREYPDYRYNDVLLLKGLLKEPESFDAFDYKNYLEKKGIHSLMSFPEIQIVKRESSFYGAVLNFKNKIRENINKSFGYLQAKLLSGILLGDQSTFSQEFKDKLNVSGLRHITAISGMNVAILCTILMSLFLGLGLWRSQAFYFTVFAIFLFVLTVGFQASVIRAGIMGIFVLLAQKTGRMSDSIRILVITSAIMLLVNPMMLRWDAGFQLSFLALLGLVLLQKHIEKLLKF
ncbi:ComEC family competence protein, partial [Patescibacteria group bacterium]|nr:ComEC family competence protein [Patescibacteria group bacterium]